MWIVQHSDFSRSPKDRRALYVTAIFGSTKRGMDFSLMSPKEWVNDENNCGTLRIEFETYNEVENLITHLQNMLKEEKLINEQDVLEIEKERNKEKKFKY